MNYIQNQPLSLYPQATNEITSEGLNVVDEAKRLCPPSNFTTVRDQLAQLGIKAAYRTMESDNYVSGSAGWKLGADGTLEGTGIVVSGTISGRSTAVIAAAIDADGHFIDDRLDTAAKNILAEFNFGVSGALQIGTYVSGTSGDIRISPNGIVGRDKNGNDTFTIDGTTGSASFSGSIAASTIETSTMTGGTIQTSTSGTRRVVISDNQIKLYDSSDNLEGVIQGSRDTSSRRIDIATLSGDTSTEIMRLIQIDSATNAYALNVVGKGTSTVVNIERDGSASTPSTPVAQIKTYSSVGGGLLDLQGASGMTLPHLRIFTGNTDIIDAGVMNVGGTPDTVFKVDNSGNTYVGRLEVSGKGYLYIKGDDDSANNPGCLVLYDHTGTPYYLWVDSTGDLRIHTSAPTSESSDGTIVGTQS